MARSSSDGTEEVEVLQDLANEGVVDILTRTKIHVRQVSLELDAGMREYDLSQSVIRIWTLSEVDGTPLVEVPDGDFSFYDGAHVFQFVGYNRLVIGWEPEAGDVIDAYYTPRPDRMTQDSHDPSLATYGLIPEEYHPAIVNYMNWKAGEITRNTGSGMGEKYRRLYEGDDGMGGMGTDLGKIKWAVNRRGASGAPQARLRRALQRSGADSGASTWR